MSVHRVSNVVVYSGRHCMGHGSHQYSTSVVYISSLTVGWETTDKELAGVPFGGWRFERAWSVRRTHMGTNSAFGVRGHIRLWRDRGWFVGMRPIAITVMAAHWGNVASLLGVAVIVGWNLLHVKQSGGQNQRDRGGVCQQRSIVIRREREQMGCL